MLGHWEEIAHATAPRAGNARARTGKRRREEERRRASVAFGADTARQRAATVFGRCSIEADRWRLLPARSGACCPSPPACSAWWSVQKVVSHSVSGPRFPATCLIQESCDLRPATCRLAPVVTLKDRESLCFGSLIRWPGTRAPTPSRPYAALVALYAASMDWFK